MVNDLSTHAYVMKPQQNLWTLTLSGASWLMNTLMCRESYTAWLNGEREWKCMLETFPDLTFYNKTMILYIAFSMSAVTQSNGLLNLWGSWGPLNLQLVGQNCQWPGDRWSTAGIWSKGSLVGDGAFQLLGSALTEWWLRELNYIYI